MKKKKWERIWKLLFFVPGIVGLYGIINLNEGTFWDCIYKTAQLYVMEFSVESEVLNPATEFARFMAPVATAAAIAAALYSMVDYIRIWVKIRTNNVIAIHGDSANKDLVMESLGNKAICSDKSIAFRAPRHILMFEDDFDMYHFMDEHGTKMFYGSEKEVFLCSEKILRGSYENRQLVVCNIAENCARDYWNKYPVTNKKEKILLLGFDNYGQRLLTQAILKNVISTDSQIEYHIAGDYHAYLSKHYHLNKTVHVKIINEKGEDRDAKPYDPLCDNHDTVYFYDMEWYEILERNHFFDRVILIEDMDAKNIELLNELKTYYADTACYMKFSDEKMLSALWNLEKENIVPFGVNKELYDPETILKEKLFYHAKLIHSRYFAQYCCDGTVDGKPCQNKQNGNLCSLNQCVSCPNLLEDWSKLTTFLRYSNVAQADHIPEKIRLLLGADRRMDEPGIGDEAVKAYHQLNEEEKKKLWQIEHIRWNRYHFMNNWEYAPVRDKKKRKHPLLVPFDELPLEEQKKDEDAYLALEEILRG